MKFLLILTVVLANLSLISSDDACQPLWPRIQFGNTFSDFSNNEKLVIRFNTKSLCPKSYAILSDSKGTIRKTYCQVNAIQCSEKMNSYQTFVQRCSIETLEFESNFSYLVYGANSTSGVAIPFSSEPIETSIVGPNVIFYLILVNPNCKDYSFGGLE